MQILAPDILADARGLSLPLHITAVLVGLALWTFGWRNHRFWVALVTTVAAGTFGLAEAPALHAHPLLAAVFLAVAAGMLALSLVRLVAFTAGGFFGLVVFQGLRYALVDGAEAARARADVAQDHECRRAPRIAFGAIGAASIFADGLQP